MGLGKTPESFSWYSRPLVIIPAAYYPYRRKVWHVLGFILLLATSRFWFAAPATIDPAIQDYLQWEADIFLSNDGSFPLLALILAVLIFLLLLFYAAWQRNPCLGLLMINLFAYFLYRRLRKSRKPG